MKSFFSTVLIAACAALVFSSCETLDPDKDFSGTPYGFWVVDKLEVELSTTINGTTTTSSSTTKYDGGEYCRLNLDTSGFATLWYDLEFDVETFVYNESTKRITFKEALDVGRKAKAIVILGIYDVELNGDNMILRQPEASIGGENYGASERATYYLHRAPKSEKPKETTND